jgi:hypothetical protein
LVAGAMREERLVVMFCKVEVEVKVEVRYDVGAVCRMRLAGWRWGGDEKEGGVLGLQVLVGLSY